MIYFIYEFIIIIRFRTCYLGFSQFCYENLYSDCASIAPRDNFEAIWRKENIKNIFFLFISIFPLDVDLCNWKQKNSTEKWISEMGQSNESQKKKNNNNKCWTSFISIIYLSTKFSCCFRKVKKNSFSKANWLQVEANEIKHHFQMKYIW